MTVRRIGIGQLVFLGLLAAAGSARGQNVSYTSASEAMVLTRLDSLEADLSSMRRAAGSDCSGMQNSCGCSQAGWIAGAEMPLLQPHNGALRLAGGGGFLVLTPDYDVQASLRMWFGYRNDEGLGGRMRYWTFDADAGPSPPLALLRGLHMETLDFEVSQIEQFSHWIFDFSGGFRWAQDRNGLLGGPDFSLIQDFQGGGGTVALSAWRPFGSRGLSLFANTRASLLYGNNNFSVINNTNQTPFSSGVLQSANDVVSVYEMQLGLEWATSMEAGSRLYLRTALEAQAWNLPSPAFGLLDDTTGLVGVTFSAGMNY